MVTQERCLQQIIGSCGGCPIRDELLPRRIREAKVIISREEVIRQVISDWCPEGTKMQEPKVPKMKVW